MTRMIEKMSTSRDLGKTKTKVFLRHKTHGAALIWPKEKTVLSMAAGKEEI